MSKETRDMNINNEDCIISFPHMGNYYSPIYSLLKRLIPKAKIMIPKKISKKTLELGEKHSPDFVCTPFKYNLGNFIESLEGGANVLIQAGGGCRFGYYAELQEQVLQDLGYNFTFIPLLDGKKVKVMELYKKVKMLNPEIVFSDFSYHFLLTIKMVRVLDNLEGYIRDNVAFEVKKGEFDKIQRELVTKMMKISSFRELKRFNNKYMKKLKGVKLDKSKSKLKVGIVGELYDEMEPFSNFFIEKQLADMNIETKRFTTVTYLLFEKKKKRKGLMKDANKYIKYELGADGTESVAHSKQLCEQGYDGIIHIKPFGCTPEINAMPILQKISNDYGIPIIYFTFDMQSSETGMKTRLEAFYDMMLMKKEARSNA